MINKATFIVLLLFSVHLVQAQVGSPDFRCVRVEQSGDITLTWIPPQDPNNQFVSYEIYESVNGAIFNSIAPIITNKNQNSVTLVGKNFPNTGSNDYRYFIRTNYNNGSLQQSAPSDTLKVMHLLVTPYNSFISGSVTWTHLHTPPLPSSHGWYIGRRGLAEQLTPNNIFWNDSLFLQSVNQNTHYADSFYSCSKNVYYQIVLPDSSGCVSSSNTIGVVLQNNNNRIIPKLEKVSINKTAGGNEIFWLPDNKGTRDIIIYHVDKFGVATPLDTVPITDLKYLDRRFDGSAQPQCFAIASVDSCENVSARSAVHCTAHFTDSTYNCKGLIKLKWQNYTGWTNIDSTEVFMRTSTQTTYRKVGSTLGADTSISFYNRDITELYTFYLAQHGANGLVSYSNLRGVFFPTSQGAKYLILRSINLTDNGECEVKIIFDKKAKFEYLRLYRSPLRKGSYQIIKQESPTPNPADSILVVTDPNEAALQKPYFYYADILDSCGQIIKKSDTLSSLYLTSKHQDFDDWVYLEWINPGLDLKKESPFSEFILERFNADLNEYTSTRNAWVNLLNYSDNIKELLPVQDNFCYRLKLVRDTIKQHQIQDTSYSNKSCIAVQEKVFIPNSFTPNSDGNNETWRPMLTGIQNFENYELKIFDRWGKIVFETNNSQQGWDGTHNNSPSSVGTYQFRLFYRNFEGSEVIERGSFNLMR